MVWILNFHILIHEGYCAGSFQEIPTCMRFCRKTLYSYICCYTQEGFYRNPPYLQSKSQLVEQGPKLGVPLEGPYSV